MHEDEVIDLEEESPSTSKILRDWIFVIVVALGAAMLVRVFVLQQFYISGPSMETSLFQDDRVLVNKLSYRLHDVNRGDVIVFDRVTTSGGIVEHDDLIKRVIAVGGDSIQIQKCEVIVNGVEIEEPYLGAEVEGEEPNSRCRVADMPSLTVPDGQLFVMGDNRAESFDSRSFGPIPKKLVIGRAFAVVWPLGSLRWL
jgi:signal peptidase I